MTAPEQGREKTAAVFFAGFLTLALGGAGLLIAALAVGVERVWTGGATERARGRERAGSWLDNQRSWLDADHKARIDRDRAHRTWLDSGATPDARPAGPSFWRRFAGSLHRASANVAIAAADFRDGFRDGWKHADRTRRDGGSFTDIRKTRPASGQSALKEWTCPGCARPMTAPRDRPMTEQEVWCLPCRIRQFPGTNGSEWQRPAPTTPGEVVQRPDGRTLVHDDAGERRPLIESDQPSAPEEAVKPRSYGWSCALCNTTRRGFASDTAAWTDGVHTPCTNGAGHNVPLDGKYSTQPMAGTRQPDNQPARHEGATMPEDAKNNQQPANGNRPAAPAGESNAAVLRGHLQQVGGTLGELSDLTDSLAKVRDRLHEQVTRSEEFATSTGQSSQARQALDQANALAAAMGQHLGNFSDGAVGAQENVQQASDGLRVAEHAEDDLRQAGADGRAVAPAGADA